MRRASQRAAAGRGGLPNAIFIWAPVERLPPELTGVTELHMIMPWGSLLRAVAGGDPEVLAGLAGACRPGARFRIALNLHPWRSAGGGAVPELGGLPEPDPGWAQTTLADRYAVAGWQLDQADYLTGPEIEALDSSWTRRLRSSRPGRFDVLALTGTVTPQVQR
ncbi:MAG: hypothetical protein GEV12_04175 [Micromonosporaceae bacterium]|nr:hypothetical protein [Micromonosporaceae bacterium]